MAAAGASQHASPSPDLEWMRRVLALPLSDAVVYVSFGALWAFTAGVTLALLGRRAGGSAGDRVAAAAISVIHVSVWPLLLVPLAVTLLAMSETVSAVDSDSEEEQVPRRGDAAARRWALWQAMMKDFKLVQFVFFYIGFAGYWMETLALEKGSFQEKAGDVLFVFSLVGVAVMNCFYVWPKWIKEWWTSQKGRKGLKRY